MAIGSEDCTIALVSCSSKCNHSHSLYLSATIHSLPSLSLDLSLSLSLSLSISLFLYNIYY